MKLKQKFLRTNRRTAAIALLLIGAAVLAGKFAWHNRADAAVAPKPAVTASVLPQFSFAGAAGWHKGPTNETSMALFRDDRECFTSIEHKSGAVDTEAEIRKQQKLTEDGGNTMTAGAVQQATVQIKTGLRQYGLHEFSLTSGDKSHPLMGGLGLGYVQLLDGYLKIQSHCNSADELASAIPALEAYRFAGK